MTLLERFLSTDYGLFSAVAIGVTLLMGVYFVWFFYKQYKADCALHEKQAAGR